MKSVIFSFFLLLLSNYGWAQKITAQTIDVSGGTHSANGYTMTYSVGQTATTTIRANAYIITQGFQQAEQNKTIDTKNTQLIDFQASVFPNPTSDLLHLSISGNVEHDFKLQVFNLNGQLLISKEFNGTTFEIEVQDLPKGEYVLTLNKGDARLSSKFLKL